ncbi:proton-coupled folate transporter-like [Plakobranchus ocellatus]|uniref:Proton-coupled folate transporter-like n=1 Tax=Plakobranchus ocellatus TaxID=259542 RepID=A0AAV4AV25_9GAST|nr:proton-coupled folate transporter-like [Plakobranchus ocellatus]
MESRKDVNSSEQRLLLPTLGLRNRRQISTRRARIILFFVHLMSSSGGISGMIMLAQYVVKRVGDDAGYSNVTSVDHCTSNTSDPDAKHANEVQEEATDLLTYLNFVQSVPTIFACFLVGSYSDYIGRRIMLLLPLLTAFINFGIISLVIGFNLDLNFLYIGFGLDGLAGTWVALLVVVFAITADISVSKDSRTLWILLLLCSGCIVTAGVTLGTSYLIDSVGFLYASLIPTTMAFVNFLVPLFFFQETLAQRPVVRIWSPMFHCRRLFGLFVTQGSRRRRATLTVCIFIFVFAVASELKRETIDSLYQLHEPFCWDARRIGLYNSIRTGGGNLLGALWLTLLKNCLPSEVVGMIGVLFQVAAYTFEGLLNKSWQFYIVPVLLVPSISTIPIVRATMSLLVGVDQQGALFSSIAVVESVAALIAGTVFTKVYSATVSTMPGAVFFLTAGCGVIAFILYIQGVGSTVACESALRSAGTLCRGFEPRYRRPALTEGLKA